MPEMNSIPIVIQALPKWDADYSSTALNIARNLSKTRKVYYVEHPYTWSDRLKPELKTKIHRRKKITEKPFPELPDFTIVYPPYVPPINLLPESGVYSYIQRTVSQSVKDRIESILERDGYDEVIYVNSFDPTFWHTKPAQAIGTVYHCVDWIGGEPYIAKHGIRAEQKAAAAADLVITTSPALKATLSKYNHKIYCVENAVDYDLFSTQRPKPKLYNELTGPIVIYGGNIGIRMNFELIKQVASAHPSWNFVFVGPIDDRYCKCEELRSFNNITLTGPKPQQELVSYLQHADVGWIPFLKNQLTKHISPLKLNEYLAAGIPVTTSSFAPFNDPENLLFQFNDNADSSAKLLEALRSNTEQDIKIMRQKKASQQTWDKKTREWISILSDHFKQEEAIA